MSKKPVPGLMGNAKFLPGSSMQKVHVGARQITRVVQPGDDDLHWDILDADSLFGGGFGDVDVFVLEQMLREAGFPEYPVHGTPSERDAIAERYTGAAPNIENPKDIRASLAWALVRFAEAEISRQHYISSNNLGGVWCAGVRMGRLAEWWVWRSEGHDAEAVHGQKFPAGTTDKATEAHIKVAQERADQVLFAARAVLKSGLGRKKNGNINHTKLAEEILRKYSEALNIRIGKSAVAQITKEHNLNGKLK